MIIAVLLAGGVIGAIANVSSDDGGDDLDGDGFAGAVTTTTGTATTAVPTVTTMATATTAPPATTQTTPTSTPGSGAGTAGGLGSSGSGTGGTGSTGSGNLAETGGGQDLLLPGAALAAAGLFGRRRGARARR